MEGEKRLSLGRKGTEGGGEWDHQHWGKKKLFVLRVWKHNLPAHFVNLKDTGRICSFPDLRLFYFVMYIVF